MNLSSWFKFTLCKDTLAKIKVKAIRRGIWFKALTRSERAQIDLTIMVVKKVRSFYLARVLYSIIAKLMSAMESQVMRLMREVGRPLAEKISKIAKSWGHKHAEKWAEDEGFIKFLTINYMNTPRLYKL